MNRRGFLQGLVTTAAGLLIPYEPQRVYSFPSQEYLNRVLVQVDGFEWVDMGREVEFYALIKQRDRVSRVNISLSINRWNTIQDDSGDSWMYVENLIRKEYERMLSASDVREQLGVQELSLWNRRLV